MEIGIATLATDEGVPLVELARDVEDHGFESLFVADHTHIPASRETPYPHPPYGELPRRYYRLLDPFVSLATVAATTSRLRLGTAVCLVVERDPIVLAKQVATLDLASNGRFIFGVGAGWNREEMRNHGTDPRTRMTLLRERVEAMKAIWTDELAEYHGELVDFDPIYSWPKPMQHPHPPVLVGGNGPTVLQRVVRFGDGWIPGHQRDLDALGERIAALQQLAARHGRDPIPVTIQGARPARLADYERIGATRCLFMVLPGPAGEIHARLQEYAEAMRGHQGASGRRMEAGERRPPEYPVR